MNKIEMTEYTGPDTVLTKQHYAMALQSQSACNLSGIAKWFSTTMSLIWDEAKARGKGTDWVNQHPICRLFAEQCAHLSGAGGCSYSNYMDASNYCEERSK